MSRIFNENMWPDGGWYFTDAQGVKHTGSSFRALINVVRDYRERGGFPLGDPEVEVTNQVCGRHPDFCRDRTPRPIPQPSNAPRNYVSTLAAKVSSWVSSMFSQKRMGKVQKVPTSEAKRREMICAKCPMQHAFPSTCGGCLENVNRLSGEVVSHEPLNHSIQCCLALAEYTPVSVWLDQPPVAPDSVPPECWRK